jgi:UPF0042 nucleotide-binding protein
VDGIAREREMLRDLRANADVVIDTSSLNVHELGAKVLQAFEEESAGLRATVISFGYKYGLPVDADLVWTAGSCPTRTGCPSCGR